MHNSMNYIMNYLFLQVRPPDNDKEMLEMDALSLIILELNYSRPHDSKNDDVKVCQFFCFLYVQLLQLLKLVSQTF